MKQVIIYIWPDFDYEENDISVFDITKMSEQERYTWAKNVRTIGVDIYASIEELCLDFNSGKVSDEGYIFVGQTLI